MEELSANYEREFRTRVGKLIRAKDQVNGITLEAAVPVFELDVAEGVRRYLEYVHERLDLGHDDVPNYKEEHLRDAIARAIRRQPPCTERGEEIRDVILWNTVLDLGAATDEQLAFISKNTKQFSEDKAGLHPVLMAEAASKGPELSTTRHSKTLRAGMLHGSPSRPRHGSRARSDPISFWMRGAGYSKST